VKLHGYQRDAVEHLTLNPRAGLFMEMGLGKTATVLSALRPTHFPALIVAPKRVAEMVWPEERGIWRPDLDMVLAVGDPAARLQALDARADVTVIGRDNLANAPQGRFRTVVLDELSSFKSHTSERFKVARRLTKTADYVWGLTGTPAPNGYMDLWSEMFLLDRGARLGTKVTDYRSRYFVETRVGESRYAVTYDLRPGARERIDSLLSDVCLSFLAEDYLDLEEPVYNTVTVPNPVAGIYNRMKVDLVADLRLIGADALHTAANAAVLSNRLSQITAGFLYSDNLGGAATRLHAEKVKAVQEIVDGTGSPVLVFYRFLEELKALQKALPQALTIEDAGAHLQTSWNAGRIPVLLAHPASIGHGLNLQKGPGHTMVFTTPPWSLEEYQQSIGRLARQGQAHRVTVHHITLPGTIDDVILDALLAKESVQDALLRYLA
jgi:SNF2 family DNA or RNA helicase